MICRIFLQDGPRQENTTSKKDDSLGSKPAGAARRGDSAGGPNFGSSSFGGTSGADRWGGGTDGQREQAGAESGTPTRRNWREDERHVPNRQGPSPR